MAGFEPRSVVPAKRISISGGLSRTRDQCYDFYNIFAEKFGKNWRPWLKTKLNYAKI
jgi:hypothetical protein